MTVCVAVCRGGGRGALGCGGGGVRCCAGCRTCLHHGSSGGAWPHRPPAPCRQHAGTRLLGSLLPFPHACLVCFAGVDGVFGAGREVAAVLACLPSTAQCAPAFLRWCSSAVRPRRLGALSSRLCNGSQQRARQPHCVAWVFMRAHWTRWRWVLGAGCGVPANAHFNMCPPPRPPPPPPAPCRPSACSGS
jgi:hypothetical protein